MKKKEFSNEVTQEFFESLYEYFSEGIIYDFGKSKFIRVTIEEETEDEVDR